MLLASCDFYSIVSLWIRVFTWHLLLPFLNQGLTEIDTTELLGFCQPQAYCRKILNSIQRFILMILSQNPILQRPWSPTRPAVCWLTRTWPAWLDAGLMLTCSANSSSLVSNSHSFTRQRSSPTFRLSDVQFQTFLSANQTITFVNISSHENVYWLYAMLKKSFNLVLEVLRNWDTA